MPASWGNATKSSGGGDANVMKLEDSNRIRIVDDQAAAWRQHAIRHPNDDDQFQSATCPGGRTCPLDKKPTRTVSMVAEDGSIKKVNEQTFPVSRRFATNVWNYATNKVEVLIAGPQIFNEFDKAAQAGIDPKEQDWVITREGKATQTKYSVVRLNPSPFTQTVTPENLHNLDKYEEPDSVESIFKKLEDFGIDYDAIEAPSFTLEEALSFAMPYGKRKGDTIEQVVASELDYAKYMHENKLQNGQVGDEVFVALQTVLEAQGEVEPLDDALATQEKTHIASSGQPSPEAQAILDKATQPAPPPEPEPQVQPTDGTVKLVPPGGGDPVQVPEASVAAMTAAGFTPFVEQPTPDPATRTPKLGPNGGAVFAVPGAGEVEVPEAVGEGQGWERVYEDAPAAQEPEPLPPLPADDEQVTVQIGAVPVPMAFANARDVVASNAAASYADPQLAAAVDAHITAEMEAAHGPAQASIAVTDLGQGGTPDLLDPSLTTQRADGRWVHPALPNKDYATKGPITQALNKLKSAGPVASATTGAQSANVHGQDPVSSSQTGSNGDGDWNAVYERIKGKLIKSPYAKDHSKIMELLEEVAGKNNVREFSIEELGKLEAKLDA